MDMMLDIRVVAVGRYVAAPRQDCQMLLGRLSNWLENDALWTEVDGALDARFAGAILRAILAHLRYIEVIQLRIAWEHFVYAT